MSHGWPAFVRCSPSRTVAALADDRRVLSGIILIILNGLRWCDAPAAYGPRKTLCNRFVRRSGKGILARILEEPARPSDPAREVLMIGATRLKAHRAASSLAKGGGPAPDRARPRGGMNSKPHALRRREGRPVRLHPTAGPAAISRARMCFCPT